MFSLDVIKRKPEAEDPLEAVDETTSSAKFLLPSVPNVGALSPLHFIAVLTKPFQPAKYSFERFHGYQGDKTGEHKVHFAKGTTTLAFKFQGGVLVAVDSRATQGNYICKLAAPQT